MEPLTSIKNFEALMYRLKGIDPKVKKAYIKLFNSSNNRDASTKIIDDLIMRFKFYGAPSTNDLQESFRRQCYREVIEYILTMSSRITDDTLSDIEQFINR